MTPKAADRWSTMPPPAKHPENRRVGVPYHHRQNARPAVMPPYSYSQHSAQPPPPASMRIPPSPSDYPYYEGGPPPPTRRHRENARPPYYSYEMGPPPREEPRPYLPSMQGEDPRVGPPPPPRSESYGPLRQQQQQREHAPPPPPPPIRYRPSPEYQHYPMSPTKRVSRHPPAQPPTPQKQSTSAPGSPQKPGDSLSLLAKVASGTKDSKHQQGQDKNSKEHANPEFSSPIRRVPPSPRSPHAPVIWTPTRSSPAHPYANHRARGPPPPRAGEWREGQQGQYPPPPMHRPREYYQPQQAWTYEGPETPPTIAERVSFDDGYHHSPPTPTDDYSQPAPPQPHYPTRGWSERPYTYPAPPPPPPEYRHHRRGYSGQYVSPSASHEMEPAEEGYHYHHPQQQQQQHAPYTSYMQQQYPPRQKEEKTVLRRKFTWRHYPELEQFLVANRDEYLRHSALNYTAEQKQYNNWLTERLLEVADHHNYVFDPEEFNFVAVRDRIRCYYKSYVQTARKRGLTMKQKKEAAEKKRAEMEVSSAEKEDEEAVEASTTQAEVEVAM